MSGLDWPGLIHAGLHGLRLAPDQFWALTPGELQVMLGRGAVRSALLSDGLASLMARFPDEKEGQQNA